jgi:DNA-binding MarR family transcriptional regulator
MEAATKTPPQPSSRVGRDKLAIKLGALVLRCMGQAHGEVLRTIDESGLTFTQMKVLIELAGDDEARTVSALAEELGFSIASASRAADGLVRRRLATRVEDSHDRRVRNLALTGKGRELADRIIEARLAGLEEVTAGLAASERKKLESALDALLERPEMAEIYDRYERKVRS